MMELRLSPITQINDPKLILSVLELFALVQGEAPFSDIDIDFDTALADIAADPAKFNLDDERELLRNEPVAGRKLIEEIAISSVFSLVEEREQKLGRNYAFERKNGTHNTLSVKSGECLGGAALATAWLSFFEALNVDDLLNLGKAEKRKIRMVYAKIFEIVALMAATQIGPSVGWWTGRSWSDDAKSQNFNRLCELVGYGKVKLPEQWQETQKQANDGGVDGFLITTVGGRISSASICIALGVTLQHKQRQKKKIGKDERDRILAFFLHRPTIPMIGAAADPYPRVPVLDQDYAQAECLYLHNEILWDLFSVYNSIKIEDHLHLMNVKIENTLRSEIDSVFRGGSISIAGRNIKLTVGFDDYAAAA